jgi:hypothetical protein
LNSGFPPEGTGTYCTTRYWYTVLYVARVGYNMDTGTGKIIPIISANPEIRGIFIYVRLPFITYSSSSPTAQ